MTLHLAVPGPTGGWLAVVRAGNALIVRPGDIPAADLYAALGSDDPVRGVIERLTTGGFAATPDFGLVARSSAGPLHVVVRGPVEIVLPDGAVSGADVSTWTERVVSRASDYEIRAPESASGDALPLVDGAVWASAVRTGEPIPAAPSAASVPPASAAATDSGSGDDGTAGAASSESASSEPASSEPASRADPPLSADTVLPQDDLPAPTAVLPVVPGSSGAPGEEPVDYDHLFEATIVRPVEAAAVRPADEEAEPSAPAAPAERTPPEASTALPESTAVLPSDPGPSDAVGGEEPEGDHDGLTVMSGDVDGLSDRDRPAEHEIAQPDGALAYAVVLPDGTREPLDSEMLIGRSPSGRMTGGVTPRLVTLSGDPDISRTHVRIALEGDTVVVTDMHSRNGTTLQVEGKSPQLLRAGEPAAVIPGTVVDLGGGTVLRIEEGG